MINRSGYTILIHGHVQSALIHIRIVQEECLSPGLPPAVAVFCVLSAVSPAAVSLPFSPVADLRAELVEKTDLLAREQGE